MKQLDIIELAKENKLHMAPKGFVGEEDLLKKNANGKTTFQLLAQKGLLSQIPPEAITSKVLLEKDGVGACGMHYLAKSKMTHKLPQKFQTKEFYEVRDYFGLSVKDYENYNKILKISKIKMHKSPRLKPTCFDYAMEF